VTAFSALWSFAEIVCAVIVGVLIAQAVYARFHRRPVYVVEHRIAESPDHLTGFGTFRGRFGVTWDQGSALKHIGLRSGGIAPLVGSMDDGRYRVVHRDGPSLTFILAAYEDPGAAVLAFEDYKDRDEGCGVLGWFGAYAAVHMIECRTLKGAKLAVLHGRGDVLRSSRYRFEREAVSAEELEATRAEQKQQQRA
jgi:hypothetical protein